MRPGGGLRVFKILLSRFSGEEGGARECRSRQARDGQEPETSPLLAAPGPPRQPREGRTCRTRRAARQLSRLLRGEISSCGGAGASWRGVGTRAFRSEIARRHAGGPRLSRPYPRRPRPPPTRWPWCMRPPTLVGARVPRARPAPRTRSDCRTSRAGGGPPGTSAPTTGPSHVPAVVWGMNGISRRSVPK